MFRPISHGLTGLGAFAALVGLAVAPAAAQEGDPGSELPARQDELAGTDILLRVDGMSCPFCAYGLEKRLLQFPAIDTLVIRVSDGLVQIRLAEGGVVTDEELEEGVEKAGFSLREIRRVDP